MIEEFTAILGCSLDSTAMIALPDLDMQIPNKLMVFFNIPPDDIYLCLFPYETMNLSSLITAYKIKDKDNPTWVRTISFCLYT